MTLGEHLVSMPRRSLHHATDFRDVVDRDVVMKEIAHRVDEDALRQAPLERNLELFGHEAKIKSPLERMARDAAKSFRESFGIAMFATRTELGASANRIPCRIGPFYGAVLAHWISNPINITRPVKKSRGRYEARART